MWRIIIHVVGRNGNLIFVSKILETTLCLSLQVWGSKQEELFPCDRGGLPVRAAQRISWCAEVPWGAGGAQAVRRAQRALQQDSRIGGNVKLTTARQRELNQFICTKYWHCCKLNER